MIKKYFCHYNSSLNDKEGNNKTIEIRLQTTGLGSISLVPIPFNRN